MGNEGEEGVKNDAKVLSLATTSGIVILLIKTGNTRSEAGLERKMLRSLLDILGF